MKKRKKKNSDLMEFLMKESKCPILDALNSYKQHYVVAWSTPSVFIDDELKVKDIYETDTSVSLYEWGKPIKHCGIFRRAEELAAKAYGSDDTYFIVNGSTSSNNIIFKYLKKRYENPRVLSTRNVHISVSSSVEELDIMLEYIEPNFDDKFGIFLPPTSEEIIGSLKDLENSDKPIDCVLITNPTYEGLSCNLEDIIKEIRDYSDEIGKEYIIYVDEAWGAHLHFSDKLPKSAMDCGADIAVQSTHKQGGALQQTSMIHFKKDRLDTNLLRHIVSRATHSSTSQSYHLWASLDAARYCMETKGKERIEDLIEKTDYLKKELSGIDGINTLSEDYLNELYSDGNYTIDKTKAVFDVSSISSGIELAHLLEDEYGIITETSNLNSLVFLTTFRINSEKVDYTIKSFKELVKNENLEKIDFNFEFPKKINKKMEHFEAYKKWYPENQKRNGELLLPLEEVEGLISADDISTYPPGIPVICMGEVFDESLVEYLKLVRDKGFDIVSSDNGKLKKIPVMPF